MSSLSKSPSSCSDEDAHHELRRGPWTVEEDTLLTHHISRHGEGRWNLLATRSGLRRTGKSCRLRWLNYLKPDVKRGNLTPEEQLLILELHSKWGNRWSKIAQHLPGRTDNEIKNYWRTRVQKQARHMKIDTNSTAFQELIRCFWMPRLLQKIQLSSPSTTISSHQNSAANHPLIIDQSLPSPQVFPNGNLLTTETSSEQSTSQSITSSESLNFSHAPQIYSEYPTSPFFAMGHSEFNSFLKGCYNFDNNISYDMENFNLASMVAPGEIEDSVRSSHVDENNWINGNNLADHSLWNMDESWQFGQPQERDT